MMTSTVATMAAALAEPVVSALTAAALAAGTWALARVAEAVGISRDHELVEALADYAEAGLRRAARELGTGVSDLAPEDAPEVVTKASAHVRDQAPKWLAKLGFTDEGLRHFVESRLP